MVNDPEREDVGGDEPMGDPAETGTRVGRGGDIGVGPEGGNVGVEETPDEDVIEGSPREPDLSGLERTGREDEEKGPGVPVEETIPGRP